MVKRKNISFTRDEIIASIETKKNLLNSLDEIEAVENLGEACRLCLQKGGKIIFAGNGGSFADSQHLAAEFISKLKIDRRPLPSIALGTNSSSITAIGNDYGFENVFSRELSVVGTKEDVFIPISTSGNSVNILHAVEIAKKLGIYCVGLTGKIGGKLAKITQTIRVPSDDVARIQECHIMIGHILCAIAERDLID